MILSAIPGGTSEKSVITNCWDFHISLISQFTYLMSSITMPTLSPGIASSRYRQT